MSEEIAPSDLANRENTMEHSHSQTSLEMRKLGQEILIFKSGRHSQCKNCLSEQLSLMTV